MKRLNAFANRHPILSMLAGWLLVIAAALVLVPADPPSVAQALHERGSST